MTQSIGTKAQPRRRRELDAMGMLVVVGLVFFHSAQVFYYSDFYVKNEPPDLRRVSQMVSTLFVSFAGLWGMPIMFLIAGLAIWYSLRRRSAGQFVIERFWRLFIPLVVGTLLLVSPMVYFGLKTDPMVQETYLQFLSRFFNVRPVFDFPQFLAGGYAGGIRLWDQADSADAPVIWHEAEGHADEGNSTEKDPAGFHGLDCHDTPVPLLEIGSLFPDHVRLRPVCGAHDRGYAVLSGRHTTCAKPLHSPILADTTICPVVSIVGKRCPLSLLWHILRGSACSADNRRTRCDHPLAKGTSTRGGRPYCSRMRCLASSMFLNCHP